MAISVNPDAIPGDDIGGEIVLVVVDNTTYAPGTLTYGTTVAHIKDIATSEVLHTANKTEKKNEKQEVRKVTNTYTVGTTGMIMQGDKGTLDYFASYVKNKTFLQFKKTGPVDDLDQWHVSIGQVTPQVKITRGANDTNTPYEHIAIVPQSAITYSATFLASLAAVCTAASDTLTDFPATAITIPVSDGYYIAEGSF